MDVERLAVADVDALTHVLHDLRTSLLREWSEESLKYEQERFFGSEHSSLPRRNFMNAEGIVLDSALYPYDDAFYPVLDAYDQLYLNQSHDPYAKLVTKIVIADCIRNKSMFRPFGTNYVQDIDPDNSDEEFEGQSDDIVLSCSAAARASIGEAFVVHATTPERRDQLIESLLKILCHASSDLQRDLCLAADIVSFLLHNLLDDERTMVFMKMLVTIDLFFDQWEQQAEEGSSLFQQGFTYFMEVFPIERLSLSSSQTKVLAAFFRWTFARYFQPTSFAPVLEADGKGQRLALVPSNEVPQQLLRACSRVFMPSFRFKESVLFGTGSNFSLDSLKRFSNSINCLLSFGLSLLQNLSPKDSMDDDVLIEFRDVGSAIVLSLFLFLARNRVDTESTSALQQRARNLLLSTTPRELTIRNPLCFANRILRSTQEADAQRRLVENMSCDCLTAEDFKRFFRKEPPPDILEIVKGLFIRGLVDPSLTGFGYGEFLLWTGYQVKPADGMVYCKYFNLPMADDDDEESDDDDDDDDEESTDPDMKGATYENDEYDEHDMTYRELADRHDLATLLFWRSVQAPWNPDSHASFSPQFRASVRTIWLSTRHKGFPMDVARRLCTFLRRDWWPDASIECWDFDCRNRQTEARALALYEKRQPPVRTLVSVTCPRCNVPFYCNHGCRRKCAGHKMNCTKLPFSAGKIDAQERQLYIDILGDLPGFLSNNEQDVQVSGSFMDIEAQANGGNEEDEESSWETVGSDEDVEMSPTMIIGRFFAAKSRRK